MGIKKHLSFAVIFLQYFFHLDCELISKIGKNFCSSLEFPVCSLFFNLVGQMDKKLPVLMGFGYFESQNIYLKVAPLVPTFTSYQLSVIINASFSCMEFTGI